MFIHVQHQYGSIYVRAHGVVVVVGVAGVAHASCTVEIVIAVVAVIVAVVMTAANSVTAVVIVKHNHTLVLIDLFLQCIDVHCRVQRVGCVAVDTVAVVQCMLLVRCCLMFVHGSH